MTIWSICQDYESQTIIISETQALAKIIAGEIATELQSNRLLVKDFGRFHSDAPEVQWQPAFGSLRVEGSQLTRGYNVYSRGMDSQIQSLRAKRVICDDIIGEKAALTEIGRDADQRTFYTDIMSRVGPSGQVIVIGTRRHLYDLYGELAAKVDRHGENIWEHINFPAIDSEGRALWDCTNDGRSHARNYPDCCRAREYLDRTRDEMTSAAFEQTFQQQPVPPESRWIQPEWLVGDMREDGDWGCLDWDRDLGHPAKEGNWIRCISVDPSDLNYWGIIVADVARNRDEFRCVILTVVRRKFTTEQFIREFESLCDQYRPLYFVPEVTLNRKWWRETKDLDPIRLKYGWRILKHETVSNKRDQQSGLASLAVDFRAGRIRIPYGDPEARRQGGGMQILITEALDAPFFKTNDVLMALWFLKWQHKLMYVPSVYTGQRGEWVAPPATRGAWAKTESRAGVGRAY